MEITVDGDVGPSREYHFIEPGHPYNGWRDIDPDIEITSAKDEQGNEVELTDPEIEEAKQLLSEESNE